MQGVALIAAKCDGTPSKVALVADLEAELRHPWIITVRQLKAWRSGLEKK